MKNLIRKILKESEEYDWAVEILNKGIHINLKSLKIGDIVIPNCVKQEEFVVKDKGLSVKLGKDPIIWAILKKNTDKNTGGIFISDDNELGKNCLFKLINRSSLKESEEYDWVYHIIKYYQDNPKSEAELLYSELNKFLKDKKPLIGSKFIVDVDRDEDFPEQDMYHIRDNLGTYETWFARDFNIKNIKSELEHVARTATNMQISDEYLHLIKVLEPFFKTTFLKESEEYDWAFELTRRDPFRVEDPIISYLEDNYEINRLTIPDIYDNKPYIVVDEKPYFIEGNKSYLTNKLFIELQENFPNIEKGVIRRSIRKFLSQIV